MAIIDELKISEKDLDNIAKIYEDGQDEITSVVLDNIDQELSVRDKEAIMAAILLIITSMSQKTDVVLEDLIVRTYKAGVVYVDQTFKTNNIAVSAVEIGSDHIEAVNAILSDVSTRFKISLETARRDVETILNSTVERQVRSRLSKVTIESIDEIAESIATTISDSGITSLVARNGRRMNLEAYSRMLARTEVVKTANQAIINRTLELGGDIVEVTTHLVEDPGDFACIDNQGKIFSLTGESKNYPKAQDDNIPPYHPNCTHRLISRPDLD